MVVNSLLFFILIVSRILCLIKVPIDDDNDDNIDDLPSAFPAGFPTQWLANIFDLSHAEQNGLRYNNPTTSFSTIVFILLKMPKLF
ncbi:unnamed protein product [Candida parapsilosis]